MVLTRRQFNLRTLRLAIAAPIARMFGSRPEQQPPIPNGTESGFPEGDYTPFGYLNNPYHSWALNRGGILRSLRGIGFGWHFPAGPGGYFDEKKNGVYSASLRLGLEIAGRKLWELEDLQPNELRCPYHSSNLLTYEVHASGVRISCTILQVAENALGVRVELLANPEKIPVLVTGAHEYRLGNAEWWGGDGVVGKYLADPDCLMTRSFAAGTVFAVGSNTKSRERSFESSAGGKTGSQDAESAIAYGHEPLRGHLDYALEVGQPLDIFMARGANESFAVEELRRAQQSISQEVATKRAEDGRFWRRAPRLEGDWPQHWKNGWVYDFETLRMMVRRPIGAYKHRWDAMQIQTPRNVLAETSIDMWALSHADPETAKDVFLGQFLDAVEANVPCMREDAVMNMVAADGSECGTSISWCYPFFCAASIHARAGDLKWLGQLYPRLVKLLRWTLANRSDKDGFIVGKCSWETGMDGARRFLIAQPTGAELIEFIRVVELQAATAQAAAILERFAKELGDNGSGPEWGRLHATYTGKTQQLWNKHDWFYDFDTHNGAPITSAGRDIGQVAPIFCGAATSEQTRAMLPNLQEFYRQSRAGVAKNIDGWTDGLQWSSLTLPYLESLWTAGEYELLSEVVDMIAERIYPSMDRRTVQKIPESWTIPREGDARVGIPGVSCEMWTPQGAGGGEGYGWGAVLPIHIMRNVVGVRESDEAGKLWLCPNLPARLMTTSKVFLLRNWGYRKQRLTIRYSVKSNHQLNVDIFNLLPPTKVQVFDENGRSIQGRSTTSATISFMAENRKKYEVRL